MRFIISALTLLAFASPAFAADEKIDIMNPYVEQQKKVVERTVSDFKKYDDRWYAHAEERYGVKLERYSQVDGAKPADDKDDKAAVKEEKIDEAKAFFKKYYQYEKDYDPAVADLYDDNADIQVTFVHQSGKTKVGTIPGDKYKEGRRNMTAAEKMKSRVTYSDLSYTEEGKNIRVSGMAEYTRARFNKPYKGFWTILLEPQKDGELLITEEHYQLPM